MISSEDPSLEQDYVMLFAYNQHDTTLLIPALSQPTPPDTKQFQEKIARIKARLETHSYYENTSVVWETLELQLHETFNREMCQYEAELAKYNEFLNGSVFVFNQRKLIQHPSTLELRDIGKASWLDSWKYPNLKHYHIEPSDIFYTNYAQEKTRHYFYKR